MRWPGSWHRKAAPRLVRIVGEAGNEINLQEAIDRLEDAWRADPRRQSHEEARLGTEGSAAGESRDTTELITAIVTGADYHAPIAALAMRFLKGGMPDAQVVLVLRGHMEAVPVEKRDLKDGVVHPNRWESRYQDIPRAVSTARMKLGAAQDGASGTTSRSSPSDDDALWPDPIDFLGDSDLTGAPKLKPEHMPEALAGFVFDTAARMGVDPAVVMLNAVVACASVCHDGWALQPKVHDDSWTENPRLWGAVVGDPSIMKTPVLKACTRPIDMLDAQARVEHAQAMRVWKAAVAAAKLDKVPPEGWPPKPKCDRYMVEGTTIEALTEVLRDDDDAQFRAPATKVLVRQDEMSGWVGDMDRYKAGGKGGGDRAAYLTLYNGGRHTTDRVGRGNFAVPNWSGCVLGGIQPEPIQRIARDAADDGLLQRFLYCVPEAQGDGEDRRADSSAIQRYEALFQALVALHPPRGFCGTRARAVVLHADAHQHRLAVNALAKAQASWPDVSNRMKAALGKWPGSFARLALTFHLIDLADANARGVDGPIAAVLPAATARRAAAYMRDILLPHLLRAEGLLFLTPQTGHARWIAGFILASEAARDTSRIAMRDVTRAYKPLRAPEHRREVVEVMMQLEVMGWLRAEQHDNPARGTTNWLVNPKLHRLFAVAADAERSRRRRAQEETAENIRRRQAGQG